jgi:hypothetical protein
MPRWKRWRAKTAPCSALPADGVAVFPADDEFTALWRKKPVRAACSPSAWMRKPT